MRSSLDLVQKLLLAACLSISIVFTPFLNIDPVGPAKMTALATLSFPILALILMSKKISNSPKILYVFLAFALNLIFVYLLSGANVVEQFYGTIGRNFGLLSQLSLIIIGIAAVLYSSPLLALNFNKFLILAGALNMVYGTVQVMGEDFVKNWSTTYVNSARGFFANPNQYSSFIAMASLLALSNIILVKRTKLEHSGSIFYFLSGLIHLYWAKSTQGFIILAFGIFLIIFLFMRMNNVGKISQIAFIVACTFVALSAVLDILQRAPWQSIIYSSTVSARGDYWRAGIEMGLNNPTFGVGIDKYLDWYRASRDDVAFSRIWSTEVTDSAHNLFIDYFAWGGFPLLICFTLLNVLTLLKIVKILMHSSRENVVVTGICIVFISYFLQSLISPIHLGITIWGWVSMGLILGLDTTKSIEKRVASKDSRIILTHKPKKVTHYSFLAVCLLLGFSVSSPFLIQDMRFRDAIKSDSTVERVYNAAYIWPKSGSRMAQISWLLYKNGFSDESLKVGLDATNYSPNNYYAWLALYSRTDLESKVRSSVNNNIERLEPRPSGVIPLK